jgi:mannose-6-phosphate isomerase-like protein (cupin superfamily)
MSLPEPVVYETLIDEADYKVSTMRMGPGSETTWHTHTHVCDVWVVCSGQLVVDYNDRNTSVILEVGQHFAVPKTTKHRVRNVGSKEAVILLTQVGGKRDFIPVTDF